MIGTAAEETARETVDFFFFKWYQHLLFCPVQRKILMVKKNTWHMPVKWDLCLLFISVQYHLLSMIALVKDDCRARLDCCYEMLRL